MALEYEIKLKFTVIVAVTGVMDITANRGHFMYVNVKLESKFV